MRLVGSGAAVATAVATIALGASACSSPGSKSVQRPQTGPAHSIIYIIESETSLAARNAVGSVHGIVTSDLPIINAVAARLTEGQRAALARSYPRLRVYPDAQVQLAA